MQNWATCTVITVLKATPVQLMFSTIFNLWPAQVLGDYMQIHVHTFQQMDISVTDTTLIKTFFMGILNLRCIRPVILYIPNKRIYIWTLTFYLCFYSRSYLRFICTDIIRSPHHTAYIHNLGFSGAPVAEMLYPSHSFGDQPPLGHLATWK